ncbi:hypothetical protein [Sutcliffiella cohnii]|uniref:Uncharacterized protein n=2 Tax=Sutcliffiella TaxID=2837511 RepID=A0A223KL69_9BACI|nr:hypothetical protein [Sutcliffiella cohnii]AST90107.1 hypothetical protein BC6307_01820 [Sutcliffiella cohnii]MED4015552.1 hypothetical protein [Sutcliffiella cohnii]
MPLSINQRKDLRKNLLEEVYENYFKKNGAPFTQTKEELRADKEKDLAYQYLQEKGLITCTQMGNYIQIKPTVHGIDYVESLEK